MAREIPEPCKPDKDISRGRQTITGKATVPAIAERISLSSMLIADPQGLPTGLTVTGPNPKIDEHPSGEVPIRWRLSPHTRPGAVTPLTAPGRFRTLLLLGEGLAQFVLLLLGQVGRDDLEVVLPELVDHPVGGGGPAGQGKQGRGSRRHFLAHLPDEIVVDPNIVEGTSQGTPRCTHRRSKERHEEDQSDQETPECTPACTRASSAVQLAGDGLLVAL